MELDKNRLKEPGFGRLLLSVLALGCAILIGFVVGLRAGDRNRKKQPQEPVSGVLAPISSADSTVDSVTGSGFAGDSAAVDTTATVDTTAAPEPPAWPAPEKKPSFSRQQVAQGVEYLASHNRWNRLEMEKIPVLAGLWDAVNTYQLDEIRRYNELLASTPLTSIVEGLEHNPKSGFYAAKADQVITLSTYIKRLR